MSLKPGYKQTEIGVIPDDWAVKELGEIAEFTNGKPNEQNVVVNGRYLLVTLDSINIQGELKTSHKQTNLLDDSLRAGDIVTVLSDIAHGNLLGLCGVIPLDHKYVLNQRMGRLRVHSGYDPGFIRLKVNRNQNHFKMRGQGTSQRHIYRRDFDCLKIGLPNSVAEQKAIAKALSDVDALIDSLEALLIKKRNIKTGVMQELLTGRTRLPGFSEDWKEVRLGAICDFVPTIALSRAQLEADEGVMCIHYGDIHTKFSDRLDIANAMLPKSETLLVARVPRLKVGDLVLADASEDLVGVGKSVEIVSVGSVEVVGGLHTVVLRPKVGNFAPGFAGLLQHTPRFKEQSRVLAAGLKVYGLSKTSIGKILVFVPPVKEQKAIAAVLSDIDDEIEALEKRLAKTRDLKQGMAQELLTGRTRLV